MKNFFRLLLFCLLIYGFQSGEGQAQDKTFTNSIGMEFVLIPSGSFMMGSDSNIEQGYSNEKPRHKVTISQPFYLGKYVVTQEQWVAVMGNNPSKFKGRTNPVEQVSWDETQEFIRLLHAKEGHNRYRLPTEAEWEYAARAGTSSAYFFGNDKNALSDYAWYNNNSGGATHPVGQKQPNAWGLYDVHGNVWEWVADWYEEEYDANGPETDPKGPSSASARVDRGGGWGSGAGLCRSAARARGAPGLRLNNIGFRLALSSE
jgi:formylglycine-generating enzyme required for sulfatase activity